MIIGAYIFANTLTEWDDPILELQRLKDYGVNTIFCEADAYPKDIIDHAHELEMRFMGGLTCFHNNDVVKQTPAYHPITADGQPRPQINWYLGITPTHRPYQQQRLQALDHMLSTYQLDGVWLDFIRWPMHWEVELRDDTMPPLETSFDTHTLNQFADWSGLSLLDQPNAQIADWILEHYRDTWADFKCDVITNFVSEVRTIQTKYAGDHPLGINIVPADSTQRRGFLGQDVQALSPHVDVFSPMVYHHILGRDVNWIRDTLNQIVDETDKPLIPFVQVQNLTRDDNFSSSEWEQVIQTVYDHPQTNGLIAFTGTQLHQNQRGETLSNYLK